MKIWRIMAHHEDPDRMIAWSKTVGRVAVGWGLSGDLRKIKNISYEDIRASIKAAYPNATNLKTGVPSLWNFWHIEVGDLAIISRGLGRRSHVVKITGGYQWMHKRQSLGDYRHQRTAIVTDHDPDKLWSRVGRTVAKGQGVRWAVARCK